MELFEAAEVHAEPGAGKERDATDGFLVKRSS
jgi:hypothetical protein